MDNRHLFVSVSPHISGKGSVPNIMWKVVIALVPALLGSVYFFGLQSLKVVLVCIITAVFLEYIIQRLRKVEVTVDDGSAVVTGLLVAYNLPSSIPLWMASLGTFIAIAVAKHMFGGLGHNIFNPALVGRAFLLSAYPVEMTNWIKPGTDGISGATPLGIVKGKLNQELPEIWDMFIGHTGGCLGETSACLLLIGALYLLATKVIAVYIPFSYLGTVALVTFLFGKGAAGDFIFQLLAGGLILGAFYMATDMVTSPMTAKGQIVFGIGCGVLTSVIRLWGGYPEGVSYAILIMNLTVPLIDKWMKPKTFGKVYYGRKKFGS